MKRIADGLLTTVGGIMVFLVLAALGFGMMIWADFLTAIFPLVILLAASGYGILVLGQKIKNWLSRT
ncbi:MAG: hypothetical protein KA155_07125 [Alphaproteobacteria bacterium]|jgi:CHASE2 domain-containing sensor protein|nr:hypothetical protein [Alphaproteobacteria bacterium]